MSTTLETFPRPNDTNENKTDEVELELSRVQYFRGEGIHRVPSAMGYDAIFSFTKWSDTLQALKDELPYNGHAITTDYATIEDGSEVPGRPDIIKKRIELVRELSKRTDAIIHLGTPTHVVDESKREAYWHNSVLAFQRGAIISTTHKTDVWDAEQEALKMRAPDFDRRKVVMGSAALICSELLNYDYEDNPLIRQKPTQIVALANFGISRYPTPNQQASYEAMGGKDAYFRKGLEMSVDDLVLRSLPSVQRVIVSDRGQPDLPAYNAVYTRKPRKS